MNIKALPFFLITLFSSLAYAQNMQNLGAPVNSALTSEYSPSLNGNGRMMIFQATTGEDNKPEVLISYAKSGIWSRPEAIPSLTSNTKLILSKDYFLTYDGNAIYFSSGRYGGVGLSDIWYVEKTGTTWSQPKNIMKPINSIGNEADPSLSADGKYLYFVRYTDKKSPTGKPCGKIYVSEKTGNLWKEAQELPASINSGCECNPRILADNQTLIFASAKAAGKGGFDQYRTQLQNNGAWSTPVPLAFINTDKDDQYISIPAQGTLLYYTGTGKASTDIFKTQIPEEFRPKKVISIEGYVKDNETQKPLSARVIAYDLKKNKIAGIIQTDADGRYMMFLTAGTQYDLSIAVNNVKNYSYYSEFIDLDTLSKFQELRSDVKLQTMKINNSINLSNIAFEGTDKISERSNFEIGRIVKLLQDNPTGSIEIAVHIDNVITDTIHRPELTEVIVDSIEVLDPMDSTGIAKIKIAKMTYHNDVTQKRANALAEAVIKKGIAKERVTAKGYGNSKPLAPNNSDSNRVLNRRTELRILKP
jgi:outer membrane protein OmpA-like peptidoglycan-associated protein